MASRRPPGHPSGRPGARPQRAPITDESALRAAVAERSKGLVVRLSRLPSYVIPGAILILLVIGITAPVYVAIPAFLVVLAFMAWLAFLSWPVITRNQRLLRLLMMTVIVVAAVARVAGWL